MDRIEKGRERSGGTGAAAWLAGVGLAVALLVPACTSSTAAKTRGCSLNSDCVAGLVCALGTCRNRCAEAADCPVPGSSCIDDGRNPVCETPTDKNTPCTSEADCAVPLACASDYRCRNLCLNDADCNVLGIAGRVCARDVNNVDYCADPNEVTNGVITAPPPPGAPSTGVIEPDAGRASVVAAGPPGDLIATNIGPAGGTVGAMGVTVTVPPGALSVDLELTIQLSGQNGPAGTVSPVFEIGPTGTTFTLPVTVAFDYTDSELGGLSPSGFAVETTAASLGSSWAPLTNIAVDVYAHSIAGQTMHLSPYGLVNLQVQQASTSRDATAPPGETDGGSDGATEAAACTNACTAGVTQCGPSGVQTCQTQASGCTGWTTTTACGPHQTCTPASVAGVPASCTCSASQCAAAGTVCQDAQTVATCAGDANDCFYAVSTSPCVAPMSCSGAAPGAACSAACTNSCTQGQTSCVPGGVATCTLGTNGCWAFAAPVTCGVHQSCSGAAGTAACTCNADPVCTTVGATCASPTSLATCTTDPQGCVYASAVSTCTSCAAGACCTSSCVQGQSMCVGPQLSTCTLGANGCWAYGTPMNTCTAGQTTCVGSELSTCALRPDGCLDYAAPTVCPALESCSGTTGTAACACTPNPCTGGARTGCADSMTLAFCSTDKLTGCRYQSNTQACTNGACSGGACCTNACTAGQLTCVVGAAAPVHESQTCTVGTNGCTSWSAPVYDPTHC
jgi:hypothetical protein